MITNVGAYLPYLAKLFPLLRHLTFNKVRMEDLSAIQECLGEFRDLNAISLKDTHFSVMCPSLRDGICGKRIATLCFAGNNTNLDITLLNGSCPNLSVLSVANATVTRSSGERAGQPFMASLRSLKLWEIRCGAEVWKGWLRDTKNLERLYLWNLVINDADMEEILVHNPLRRLCDIRIGSSEIGFIRLTEDTAARLIASCPDLRSIGGICDWNTRDLLSLLHRLLLAGGWRISLENECSF
jgi:hypothetical protein